MMSSHERSYSYCCASFCVSLILTLSATMQLPQLIWAELDANTQKTEPTLENRNEPVSLDIREADIRDVLTMLSEQYNLNMVIDDSVTGFVSLRLEDVTLHGALQALLVSRGYDYETDNNIIRVAATEILSSERQIRQERLGFEPLVTETITLRYLDAKDVQPVVQSMLTERGTVSVLERRNFGGFQFGSQRVNTSGGGAGGGASSGEGLIKGRRGNQDTGTQRSRTLLISDTRSNIERVKEVIQGIDVQPKQVLIDAKILEVETDTLEDLGIEFDGTLTIPTAPHHGYNRLVADVNQGNTATAFPSSTGQGLDLRFNKLAGESFNTVLHALLQDTRTRTLSSPQIVVLDGQEAAILVGEQFPIFESTVSDQGTATESLAFYQPVGISLQVVPQITADSNINMVIHPTVSSVGEMVTGSTGLTQPRINIREADTQLLVKDNETIILGGLLEDVDIVTEFRIPILGHLPAVGKLFTRTRTDIDQRNLIVFITPRIVESRQNLIDKDASDLLDGIGDPNAYGSLKERRDKMDDLLKTAKTAYKKKDYEEAARHFERMLRLDPANDTAKSYLVKIRALQG